MTSTGCKVDWNELESGFLNLRTRTVLYYFGSSQVITFAQTLNLTVIDVVAHWYSSEYKKECTNSTFQKVANFCC